MAQIATASTLISAVMETAGYISQERILDNFQQFFQAAGVFVWVFGALIALTSIAVFGAYRMGIYFLMGPIIFYFLVSYRTESAGVVWQLADEKARSVDSGPTTAAIASKEVRVLASGENNPKDTIRVSWFFNTFANVIDRVVNQISAAIVPPKEVEEGLLFVNKNYALDSLLGMKMQDDDLLAIFQREFLVECNQMMDASLMMASAKLSVTREQQLIVDETKLTDLDTKNLYRDEIRSIQRSRAEYEAKRVQGTEKSFNPGPTLRSFMQSQLSDGGDNATRRWSSDHPSSAPGGQLNSDFSLSCGDAWYIIRDKVLMHADDLTKKMEQTYAKDIAPEKKGLLCVNLARSIGILILDSEESVCREKYLVELAGTLLISNAISQMGHSVAIREIENRMELIETTKAGRVISTDRENDSLYELAGGESGYVARIAPAGPSGQLRRQEALYIDKRTGAEVWRPIRTLNSDIMGHKDSVFIEHQRYQTRELRQKFFSLAMQFPYYQGLLLCLLATAFPFFALLLVIPSKAGGFVNFILAWLWIKSWNIGFAVLIVMDKTFWSLFPPTDFDSNFFGGYRSDVTNSLPTILAQGLKIDPSYNTHAYYFLLTTTALAIPGLFGYLTLKLRRNSIQAISQLFTNPMMSAMEQSAGMAGQSYGMTMMNLRASAMMELGGAAQLSVGPMGQDFGGGGRGKSAEYFAKNISTAKALAAENITGLSPLKIGDKFIQAPQKAALIGQISYAEQKTGFELLEAKYDSKRAEVFDSVLGRWGELQTKSDAYAAAMDGSGTYEINRIASDKTFLNPRMEMMSVKLRTMAETDGLMDAQEQGKLINATLSAEDINSKRIFDYYRGAGDEAARNWAVYKNTGVNIIEAQMQYLVADQKKKQEIRQELRTKIGSRIREDLGGDGDAEIEKFLNPTFGYNLVNQDQLFADFANRRKEISDRYSEEELNRLFSFKISDLEQPLINPELTQGPNWVTEQSGYAKAFKNLVEGEGT